MQWVKDNTHSFLALDLAQTAAIVEFRRERERVTLPRRIREDIYVCPFIGFVATEKTGCLLHPQGSPHPQIALLAHPQNFSFYGEGICLSYDCLAKERKAFRRDFFLWAEKAPQNLYGRLASDHTLHRALAGISDLPVDLSPFYTLLAKCYERYGVVTTSFEDIEKNVPATRDELCHLLAGRISAALVRRGVDSAGRNAWRASYLQRLASKIEALLSSAIA